MTSNPRYVPTLRDWLNAEPYTLVMSSGFFGFYAHTGVLLALEEAGVLPARAAGASAGALVTGAWSAGVPAEQLRDRLATLERGEFWDPAPGPGLLRGGRFAALLDALLPVRTFAECRIPVSMSVFDLRTRRTRVLSAGLLRPAIQASCSIPGMFHPVRHVGTALVDGGIRDRPGLAGVEPGQRVFYHHLASRWLGNGIPSRPGMVALEIAALPRADPFRLQRGREAMRFAQQTMKRALQQPVAQLMQL